MQKSGRKKKNIFWRGKKKNFDVGEGKTSLAYFYEQGAEKYSSEKTGRNSWIVKKKMPQDK